MKGWIAVVMCVVLAGCRTPEPPVVEAAPATPPPRAVDELIGTLGRLEEVSDGYVSVPQARSSMCANIVPAPLIKTEAEYGPHTTATIRVSMTESAAGAFRAKSIYPVGAAIVKYKGSGGIGGMIKREPGYDDLGGDWEYFYAEAKGRLDRGKLETCRTCHMTTRSTDHVFGSWKPAQRTQEP